MAVQTFQFPSFFREPIQGPLLLVGSLSTDLHATSEQWYNSYTTVVNNSGSTWLGVTTNTVTSDVSAGGIIPGQIITANTSFQNFVETLLIKTFFPTFIIPSISNISSNIGTNVEAGTTGITLTVTFLSGSIVGNSINGIWDPNLIQNSYSGQLTGGNIFNTQIGTTNTFNTIQATSSTVVINDGINTFNVQAHYLSGPQPFDSKGLPYLLPLPAGIVQSNITINGRRRGFWSADLQEIIPTTSNEIRSLTGTVLNPAVNTNYDIAILTGTKRIVFAYPTTLGLANGTNTEPAFKDIVNNFDYTSNFGTPSVVSVFGLNSFTPINYYVYTYIPSVPFPGPFTLRVII